MLPPHLDPMAAPQRPRGTRIAFFDTVRGFTILSMIGFHASYDLVYLFGVSLPLFLQPLFQDAWRASISWTFLFLAGWMTSCSRNNAKRSLRYAAAALIIWLATTVAAVDTPVNFGIIYCMAACTGIYALAERQLHRVSPRVLLVISIIAFILTINIPHATYQLAGFAWLGFPSAGFASGDYYPLIPFGFMYLAGASAAAAAGIRSDHGYPEWMSRDWCPPLTWMGTKSLAIYLIHQPLLLALLNALFANGILS